jgi:hypothetical protein
MYTQFPYDVNKTGGWYDEDLCPSEGSVANNEEYYRHSDWTTVNSTLAWIEAQVNGERERVAALGRNTHGLYQDRVHASRAAPRHRPPPAHPPHHQHPYVADAAGTTGFRTNPDTALAGGAVDDNNAYTIQVVRPFFAYQGMNIVHPGYATNKYWLAKINISEVTVPYWCGDRF